MINLTSANGLSLQEVPNVRVGNRFSAQLRFQFTVTNFSALAGSVQSVTVQSFQALQTELTRLIDRLITAVARRERLGPTSRMRLILSNGVFNTSTPLQPVSRLSSVDILNKLAGVLQSFAAISLLNTFLYVQYARPLSGGSYGVARVDIVKFIKSKRSIVEIVNREGFEDCFWQCLSLARVEHGLEDVRWRDVISGRSKHEQRYVLSDRLRDHYQRCEGECMEYKDIEALAREVGVRIVVFEFPSLRLTLDAGSCSLKVFMAVLAVSVENGTHFHYIRRGKIGSLWNRSKFCYNCCKPYMSSTPHRCGDHQCVRCGREGCEDDESKEWLCSVCCLRVRNVDCKRVHENRGQCKRMKRCVRCKFVYDPKKETRHECGKRRCKNCKQMADPTTHACYLRKVEKMRVSEKYIYYDMECTVTDNLHEVAGIVAMEFGSDTPVLFTSVPEFLNWVLNGEHVDYTCIAHNGGRYDVHFIKRELLKMRLKMDNCVTGRTFLCITLPKYKVRFIDSYRFIPTALRKFPKTFGFHDVEKTFFPYRFFTRERVRYIGPLPDREYFEVDSLSAEDSVKFETWYRRFEGKNVDLYKMCMDYCIDDVRVLKRGCETFRETFLNLSEGVMDPFQYVTIASVCYNWYRYKHLPDESIAMFRHDNMSSMYEYFESINIACGLVNECPGGYYASAFGKVYVFKVCSLSGCQTCFSKFTQHAVTGIPMHDLHHLYISWKKQWCSSDVVEKRECDWNMEHTTGDSTPAVKIDLRSAFFGGRTEAIGMLYECNESERIRYLDYTSLYPCTQFGRCYGITQDTCHTARETPYPIGFPEVVHNATTLDGYFGFARCRVNVPYMHLPPLPTRERGKLIFRCGIIEGTWTTEELNMALDVGVVIERIDEIWHFKERSTELFKNYIQQFLKIKYCAAGWEALTANGESKEEVVDTLNNTLDIDVGVDDIADDRNGGMYTVSKLCLNSLWGKFAQRSDRVNVIDTYTDDEFDKVVFNDEYEICSVYFHTHAQRTIQYRKKLVSGMMLGTTNLAVACFTTSYARMRLYEALKILGNRVLYMDTDSIIFVEKKDEEVLVCGSRLGDLTDELDGDEIRKFVSTGPKSYAYVTRKGKHVCKIKGFTLKGQAAEVLNFDSMRGLVRGEQEYVKTQPFSLEIHEDYSITTRDWTHGKVFRVTNNKRQVISNVEGEIFTHPFIE